MHKQENVNKGGKLIGIKKVMFLLLQIILFSLVNKLAYEKNTNVK